MCTISAKCIADLLSLPGVKSVGGNNSPSADEAMATRHHHDHTNQTTAADVDSDIERETGHAYVRKDNKTVSGLSENIRIVAIDSTASSTSSRTGTTEAREH